MFDPIRNRYALSCPNGDERVLVPVSSFRVIRRLRGAAHPAVFRVEYDCPCGDRHEALVAHDQLDWEPLGTDSAETFTDLLTGRRELLATELVEHATSQLRRGAWPWTFWCHPEGAVRPGFPSALRFITPEHGYDGERVGTLVRCATCARHTVNFVTRDHLDVPWHNDDHIAYVAAVFDGEELTAEERFRQQLELGSQWIADQPLEDAG